MLRLALAWRRSVADAKKLECFEVPTGWKFFGNLMDAGAPGALTPNPNPATMRAARHVALQALHTKD